jgi:hypothetical protein
MKTVWFKTAVVLPGFLLILATAGLGGCGSTPVAPERPDSEKIKQGSDKSMQDLREEEERQRGGGY